VDETHPLPAIAAALDQFRLAAAPAISRATDHLRLISGSFCLLDGVRRAAQAVAEAHATRRAALPDELRAWLDGLDAADHPTLAGLVFADWLDDRGHDELAGWVRQVHRAEGEVSRKRLAELEVGIVWAESLDQVALTPPPSPGR
jgi:uncharacterized protein (TIGR02996 family)